MESGKLAQTQRTYRSRLLHKQNLRDAADEVACIASLSFLKHAESEAHAFTLALFNPYVYAHLCRFLFEHDERCDISRINSKVQVEPGTEKSWQLLMWLHEVNEYHTNRESYVAVGESVAPQLLAMFHVWIKHRCLGGNDVAWVVARQVDEVVARESQAHVSSRLAPDHLVKPELLAISKDIFLESAAADLCVLDRWQLLYDGVRVGGGPVHEALLRLLDCVVFQVLLRRFESYRKDSNGLSYLQQLDIEGFRLEEVCPTLVLPDTLSSSTEELFSPYCFGDEARNYIVRRPLTFHAETHLPTRNEQPRRTTASLGLPAAPFGGTHQYRGAVG
ncbi:MAG: hypothetical protein KVP17_002767 [Porospora cf. gigantea B]|uniref:uncharacterized protein n=1 Tax=Porospora cf. gigantea B TaxID=2853592 RepID=UPI003571DF44|nr:MAG: hypothetical protein KVP17_002767 [Porospora cf. gigantea B]